MRLTGGIDQDNTHTGQFEIRGIKGLWWDGVSPYFEALDWVVNHNLNFLMLCYTSLATSARDWRSGYSSDELEQMHELADQAKRSGVHLCLAVNPSLYSDPPLVYSSENDYRSLVRKIRQVHSLGIEWFALCLDDISYQLQDADVEMFENLQSAHVHLVNRLWNEIKTLNPAPRLMFCPSTYTTYDAGNHPDYITAIGEEIDPDVMILWTGTIAFSSSITKHDAETFGRLIRRKPFVWDNYPANDFYAWRPCLGPLKNRSADLGSAVSGYVANPMKQWYASAITLESTAAYLNDPEGYDPGMIVERVVSTYPDSSRDTIRLLLDLYGHSFWGEPDFPPSPSLSDPSEAQRVLPDYRSLAELLSHDPSLSGLWKDMSLTLERDIALLERMAGEGATDKWPVRLTGLDFDSGGAADFGYNAFGRVVNYIYAKSTGRDEMRSEFNIPILPRGSSVLRIVARNGEGVKGARVQIVLNDWMVVDSEVVFGGEDFEEIAWVVPDGILREGHNVITIRNVEMRGSLGSLPWFMVSEAGIVSECEYDSQVIVRGRG